MLVVQSKQKESIKALMEQVVPGYNDLPIEATTQISNVSAVIKKDYDPDVIPTDIWRTWVNTATWDLRVSNGKTAISDWIAQTWTSPTPDIVWWSTDIVRSATDYNTVAWTSWTISLAGGSSFSVNSGNTWNISAINYVYYDGTTTLKITTTPQTAVWAGKILLCVAKNSTSPTLAQFQAFWTLWQNVFITADNIAANTITANQIASNTITATQISSSYVYAGTINADNITSGTITGRTIQTDTDWQRVVIDSSNNRIQFYNSSNQDAWYIVWSYNSTLWLPLISFSAPLIVDTAIFTDWLFVDWSILPFTDWTIDLWEWWFRWNNIYLNGWLNFDNWQWVLSEVSWRPVWAIWATNYWMVISEWTTSSSSLTAAWKVAVNIAGITFKLLYNNT